MEKLPISLGALHSKKNDFCNFLVWTPLAEKLWLEIIHNETSSELFPMEKSTDGYFSIELSNMNPGTKYFYHFDQLNRRPDPASRYQPLGVFGPSEVTEQEFPWTDQLWQGIRLQDYVIYELHVGLYTAEGTFTAVISHLDELKSLGITAIELMPIAQFSGRHNWGYDAVFPFAVHNTYGGPNKLREFVDACHQRGIAVILDVIYNHLGPEGNYFDNFGYYYTNKYKTPWGKAFNLDGAYSNHVRRYLIENALHWMAEYHIDGLRLDAIQEIYDKSAYHFLEELTDACDNLSNLLNKHFHLIAESNLNNIKIIKPKAAGGFGLHAQWNDEFHHSLHSLITNERNGYYEDFGELTHLAKAYEQGFVYSGQYSPFKKCHFGLSSASIPPYQLVVFAQNHDQVGNHYYGERFTTNLTLQQLKLIAATFILSPYIPLIFMGEEYAEITPFYFFTDFQDKNLIAAVQKGRMEEFLEIGLKNFCCSTQDESTFKKCKLNHNLKYQAENQELWEFYKILLQLRKHNPVLANLSKEGMLVWTNDKLKILLVKRILDKQECLQIFNFNFEISSLQKFIPAGNWQEILSTSDQEKQAIITDDTVLKLAPFSFMLLQKI